MDGSQLPAVLATNLVRVREEFPAEPARGRQVPGLFRGIRFKLSALTFLLLAAVTMASSAIVMAIMDEFVLRALINQGFSMGRSASNAAAYSLASDDRLGLDSLVAKLKETQDDVVFVAAVDTRGTVRAHSALGAAGRPFQEVDGVPVQTNPDGSSVVKTGRLGISTFEFKTPIVFAKKELGKLHVGLASQSLVAAQARARTKIAWVSGLVLALGLLGTYLLSAMITTPIKALAQGVSELSSGQFKEGLCVSANDELGELSRSFNRMAGVIIEQKASLQRYAAELEDSYVATVKILAAAIDARDPYTLGHSERVATMSGLVGRVLNLSEDELKDLELACLLHDVGKIRTPDHVLHKQARLDKEEERLIQRHPGDGAEILRIVESLHDLVPAVLHHHEWYNGEGYPNGLKGERIPVFASIIAIADSYDAMTSSRPYRKARPPEAALNELRAYRGIQFHPELTDLFVEVMEREIAGQEGLLREVAS